MKLSPTYQSRQQQAEQSTKRTAVHRNRMRAVANNAILHLHPTKVPVKALRFSYTWGLGGISALLAVILTVTGILLSFRYEPNVDRAYTSILQIETQMAFGSLFRSVHHWSANLLVIITFLHLLRVFLTGGYKKGRAMNWFIGVLLLLVVLAFNFTGYLLPWDQLAYWAITVSTSLLSYIPAIGNKLSGFVLGGPEIGQGALSNFYGLHVSVLPMVLITMMAYHFWKIRKNGGISQPERNDKETIQTATTIPHLVSREFAAAGVVLAGVILWAMWLPAPLDSLANPAISPNPAKAAWYFLGLQELLLHMNALAAMSLAGIVLIGIVVLPLLDKRQNDIGVYFRSTIGRKTALLGFLLGVTLVPILVIVDEFWLDWGNLLTTWPSTVTNGLVPLLLSLIGLALIYGLMRLLRSNHSEALLGLGSFVFTGLIVLTIIGIYFRGPNMALALPF
jgi:quinol-cytochrome oxidoreductase complex cytochrome b subunit